MKAIAKVTSYLSLLVLIVPSFMFLAGHKELDAVKNIMLLATVGWFIFTPLWMWKDK